MNAFKITQYIFKSAVGTMSHVLPNLYFLEIIVQLDCIQAKLSKQLALLAMVQWVLLVLSVIIKCMYS